MNNRIIPPGVYAFGLLFLLGIWLVIAPFATQTQPVEATWQLATINDMVTGGILIVLSVLGSLVTVGLTLRGLIVEAENQKDS